MDIVLEVPGQPVPQPRARVTIRGGHGHAYTEKKHRIHAYRRAVELAAKASGQKMPRVPTVLSIIAVFERPKSHWLKNGLSPKAPLWPVGDGDNIQKGVADALKDCGFFPDDDQVVDWHCRKRFAARNEQARTIITIREDA
jgi:Holliday junction resolvase RusA-like endonuclease